MRRGHTAGLDERQRAVTSAGIARQRCRRVMPRLKHARDVLQKAKRPAWQPAARFIN
jgi:hypothetical protein